MAKPEHPYQWVIVESFRGRAHGGTGLAVHLRPIEGQPYSTSMRVEASKKMLADYPVGTRFKIWAKLTDRENKGEFLYSSYKWKFEVVERAPTGVKE